MTKVLLENEKRRPNLLDVIEGVGELVEAKKHPFKKIKTMHKLLLTRTTDGRSRIRDER